MALQGNKNPVFVDGLRTAFVKSLGAFEDCDTLELFSRVTDGLLRKLALEPKDIDELIAGAVVPQTKNPNIARDTILNLSLPPKIHGYTLNRTCASSLQSVADAVKTISYGKPHFILAGGVECLSDVPIVYSREARKFMVKLAKAKSAPAILNIIKYFRAKAWLPKPPVMAEPLTGKTMGEHCELMAQKYGISRQAQDDYAMASHAKAARAQEEGRLAAEILPLWPSPHYSTCIDRDDLIRFDLTRAGMGTLVPAFDKRYGSLTVGNSAPLSDGAAIGLIGDESRARAYGFQPKARIIDYDFVALDPHGDLLIGPALTIPRLLRRHKLQLRDIDRFEIHEAFAAQVLSCLLAMDSKDFCASHLGMSKAFGCLSEDRLNVNGGALALGHPFGATGMRMVASLSNELIRSDRQLGVIAIGTAGGMAGSLLLERL